MRIRIRFGIVSTFVFITVFGFLLLSVWTSNRIRPNYLKLVEENLVDTSRVLAVILSEQIEEDSDALDMLPQVFDRVYTEPFRSTIYEVTKTSVDLVVYVTNEFGKVVYHSTEVGEVGKDYSGWRNIRVAESGGYGARATRLYPDDATSLQLHVSAPIVVNGRQSGVLTIVKPVTWATVFIEDAKKEITIAAIAIGAISLTLSFLMSAWLIRPIERLTRYARNVAQGGRDQVPGLGHALEVQDMGRAFEDMHNALEGKEYVEQYIQSLTHEIKSPVSAIQGAAELINESMPIEQQRKFLENIRVETKRINWIVERLLELSAVEKLNKLENTQQLPVGELVRRVVQTHKAVLFSHSISVSLDLDEALFINGDDFLIKRAVSNLLQNAIDFSPENSQISIRVFQKKPYIIIEVEDNGVGVPEFAKEKLFERFFSMPRPNSGRKSSGLGLVFVKQIMELHKGTVEFENGKTGGAVFRLNW